MENKESVVMNKGVNRLKSEKDNENVQHKNDDIKDFIVIKKEVSEESVTVELEPLKIFMPTVKVEIEVDEEVKLENTTCECAVCFLQLPDENAYYEHMKIHLKQECEPDGEEWTRRSSCDSSLGADHKIYNHITVDQPDEPKGPTDLPPPSKSDVLAEEKDSATLYAELMAARKSKAQKQREYRQRIAASRTAAQAKAARKSDAERQRICRQRKAAKSLLSVVH